MTEPYFLESERLRFRRLTEADTDFIHSMLSDPEHMRFYPRTYSRAEALAWIRWNLDLYEQHGFGLWGLAPKDRHDLIGQCGLTFQDVEGTREIEIGYHVHKSWWGRGLATEAARTCRDYGFERLGLSRLVITTGRDNVPSQAVARNVGMSLEKSYVKIRDGRELPHLLFSLERGEA